MSKVGLAILFSMALLLFAIPPHAQAQNPSDTLDLSRPVRPWEFLPAVGTKAALFGNEAGHLEAWVYPLKILRDFHLEFHIGGKVIPADALARFVTVRPESCTILYADTNLQVRETLFVPVNEPGALITLAVETSQPLEVNAVFKPDFTLEWPASLGGAYLEWDSGLHAFFLGDELKKFAAFVGSPEAVYQSEEYSTNYWSSSDNSFVLSFAGKVSQTKTIVIAASSNGRQEAEETYRRLVNSRDQLLVESANYYAKYLNQTLRLDLPDPDLQKAYDWSRVSMIQGLVSNPFVGRSLVAGYNMSGEAQRPGFAWFFGRDSLWTSLALDATDDFASSRAVLEFLAKYQRKDGKIPHEVSQSATFVPWFQSYPYPYASADATPLFLIAMKDYVIHSGDIAFAKEKWDNIWNAYQYLRSTYDAQGLAQNAGVGHGWIEGGPLLPIKTELYQCALGAEAVRAVSHLLQLIGREELSKNLTEEFERQRTLINRTFWSAEDNTFAFALDTEGKRVNIPSVLATVPMWFGLLDEDKSERTIDHLADFDHQTDWGMRILSSRDPKYNPEGYHFGTVWPLFTGWASVGEYRYHRDLPAYSNLRANALLALDGSLGHVTEVLSGNYYVPTAGGTPDQIWSAAMVVSPLLRGLLGLDVDATARRVVFAPHVPADWSSFSVRNLQVGSVTLELNFVRTADRITLNVIRKGDGDCTLDFEPALSPRAKLVGATVNGRKFDVDRATSAEDQHVVLRVPIRDGQNILQIRVRDDFGLGVESELPSLGDSSRGLRVVSETWTAGQDDLRLDVAGIPGRHYDLSVLNASQILNVEGATLTNSDRGNTKLRIEFPASGDAGYKHAQVTIHFRKK